MAKTERSRTGAVRFLLAAGVAVTALAISSAADAYQAYVTASEPLLAGPGTDYPPVADLSSGEPVEVYGCVDGWYWCDVSFQGYRGWFDGTQLVYPYEGQRVPLGEFGVRIGIPVVGFSFDEYWGAHYRDRPFFAERQRYASFGVRPRGGAPSHGPEGRGQDNRGPENHGPENRGGDARAQEHAAPAAHPEVQRAPPHLDPGHAPEQRHAAPRQAPAQAPHPQAQAPHPAPAPHPTPAAHPAEAPHPEEHGGEHREEEHH